MARAFVQIENQTDADFTLPQFAESKADEDAKKFKKVTLGAACDEGIVGTVPHSIGISQYALERLKQNTLFMGAVKRKLIRVRGASLDIEADLAA